MNLTPKRLQGDLARLAVPRARVVGRAGPQPRPALRGAEHPRPVPGNRSAAAVLRPAGFAAENAIVGSTGGGWRAERVETSDTTEGAALAGEDCRSHLIQSGFSQTDTAAVPGDILRTMARIPWTLTLATAALVAAIPHSTYWSPDPARAGLPARRPCRRPVPARSIPPPLKPAAGCSASGAPNAMAATRRGPRGPDLTGLWIDAAADERAFQTIRTGIPGSIMPSSSAPDDELRAIISYLRSSVPPERPSDPPAMRSTASGSSRRTAAVVIASADAAAGSAPICRRSATSRVRRWRARFAQASASFTLGYEPVMLVTRDGQQIRGARKGEDPFSIQIMDTRERLQGYLKANLREVTRDKTSLMPDFGAGSGQRRGSRRSPGVSWPRFVRRASRRLRPGYVAMSRLWGFRCGPRGGANNGATSEVKPHPLAVSGGLAGTSLVMKGDG